MEHGLIGNHQTEFVKDELAEDSGFNSANTTSSEDLNSTHSGYRLLVFSTSDQAGLTRM